MWDSSSLLQLIKSMPTKLTGENLDQLQSAINSDKYKNSVMSGFDLCGIYAPFCRDCKKTSIYPCAVSYVNFMKASGMKIEIDARPVESSHVVPAKEASASVQQSQSDGVENAEQVKSAGEKPVAGLGNRKIRIAFARRKSR